MTSSELVTKAIKSRMAFKGMTQQDLASQTGVNRVVLARYLANSREWPLMTLDRIAPSLGWNDGTDIFAAARREEREIKKAEANR